MRPCLVEVGHIRIHNALELPLLQDQQVIQTFLPHAPQEALANSIGSGCMMRRFENLNAACRRHPSKAGPKFTVVISKEIFRCLPIGGGFSQLLSYPGVGRRARHAHMDDLACLELDEEEGKERSKEQIGDLQEVAGPDLSCVVAQKCRPLLTSWLL